MLINKATEEIRKTRHDISAKYHHSTKELLEHYKELESKYSDRIYTKTKSNDLVQVTPKKLRTCLMRYKEEHANIRLLTVATNILCRVFIGSQLVKKVTIGSINNPNLKWPLVLDQA